MKRVLQKIGTAFTLGLVLLLTSHASLFGQTPTGTGTKNGSTPKSDSAIIFESPRPLLEDATVSAISLNNAWGFSAFFSDYGFGAGLFYQRKFGADLSAVLSLDLGSAKGPKEFGFITEIKINNIFVLPLIGSLQYRLFDEILGDNLRPYVTAGAGPVFVLTTPGQDEFFSSFGHPKVSTTFGGFVGAGANFGVDRHSTFGANLRYYIIPYPAPGIESTASVFLTDFNGFFLTVNYAFNF
jgi:hypothetical protein